MAIRIDGDNATATPGITGGDADTGLVFGTNEIEAVTGGTTRFTVESNGNVTIEDGNLVVASGHGIDFSADGNAAGMTSELLDDYEEGTWTPDFDGMPSDLCSYATYTKIGRVVTVNFGWSNKTLPTYSGRTNNLYVAISGLPFTTAVDDGRAAGSIIHINSFAQNGAAQVAVFGSDTLGAFVMSGSRTWQNSSDLSPGSGRYFHATVTYAIT